MKKIAVGYYNAVYDLENGRVFKKKNNLFDRFNKIYSEQKSVLKVFKTMYKMPTEHLAPIELELMNNTYVGSKELLANPVFEQGGYTQDKVVTIKDYFENHNLEQNKQVIQKYVASIYRCWQDNIHEKIFNFTVNCGIDKQGNVVLIDINETNRNKADALTCIRSKRWLKCMSYLTLKPELQRAYMTIMDDNITEQMLDKYWK